MAKLLEDETHEGSANVERDVPIPTRDGALVAADVYRPAAAGPFGCAHFHAGPCGTGHSTFSGREVLAKAEQRDVHGTTERIARQPWSAGRGARA